MKKFLTRAASNAGRGEAAGRGAAGRLAAPIFALLTTLALVLGLSPAPISSLMPLAQAQNKTCEIALSTSAVTARYQGQTTNTTFSATFTPSENITVHTLKVSFTNTSSRPINNLRRVYVNPASLQLNNALSGSLAGGSTFTEEFQVYGTLSSSTQYTVGLVGAGNVANIPLTVEVVAVVSGSACPEDEPEDTPRDPSGVKVTAFGGIKISNATTTAGTSLVTETTAQTDSKFQKAVVKISSPQAINLLISRLDINPLAGANLERRVLAGDVGEKYIEFEFYPSKDGQQLEDAELPQGAVFTFTHQLSQVDGLTIDIEIYGTDNSYNPAPVGPDKNADVPEGHARVVVQVGGDRYLKPNGRLTTDSNDQLGVVEGRRASVRKYTPQAGARLHLMKPLHDGDFGDKEAGTEFLATDNGELIDEDWAECVSDSAGECVFDIPVTGDNVFPYYWVTMTQAAPGFDIQHSIRVGGSGDENTVEGTDLRYTYATPHLEEGVIYYSGKNYSTEEETAGSDRANGTYAASGRPKNTASFMYEQQSGPGGYTWHNRSSFGVMQQVRQNPATPNRCGLRVGFVVDVSSSMGRAGVTSIQNVLNNTVKGLENTGTELGMVAFNNLAPAIYNHGDGVNTGSQAILPQLSPQAVNTTPGKAAINEWISNLSKAPDGWGGLNSSRMTNWEGGLARMAEHNEQNPTKKYDVVFMVTDGNPTSLENYDDAVPEVSGGYSTEMRHVEAAIGVSNTLKAQGTRVVSVGIPSAWPGKPADTGETQLAVSEANLSAISGRNPDGTQPKSLRENNFATFDDVDELSQALKNAINTCAITVERRFYEGTDTNTWPTRENTRATVEESKQWRFDAELQPVGAEKENQSKTPVAFAGYDNLISEFKLNGLSDYESAVIEEPSRNIPTGWVRMDAGPNGQRAQCFESSQSDAAEVPTKGLEPDNGKTNDFTIGKIPLIGGYHCIVYYRSAPSQSIDLMLNKVDYQNQNNALNGADFSLTRLDLAEGQDPVVERQQCPAPNVADSCFYWPQLDLGRYQLVETRTPTGGYSLLPQPVFFRIDLKDDKPTVYILTDAQDTVGTEASGALPFPIVRIGTSQDSSGAHEIAIKLANTKTGELPKTGGLGIWLFALAGLLICGVAAVVAIRRK